MDCCLHVRKDGRIWTRRDVPRFNDPRTREGGGILYPSDAGWRQVRERLAWLYWNGKGCAGAI